MYSICEPIYRITEKLNNDGVESVVSHQYHGEAPAPIPQNILVDAMQLKSDMFPKQAQKVSWPIWGVARHCPPCISFRDRPIPITRPIPVTPFNQLLLCSYKCVQRA